MFDVEDFEQWLATFPSSQANNSCPVTNSFVDPLLHILNEDEVTTLQSFQNTCPPAADPPTPSSTGKRKRTTVTKLNKNQLQAGDAREIHICSERERRRTMNCLFSQLASLLPEASPKADKCAIVTEIISYIQALEQDIKELSKKKEEAMNMGKKNTVIHTNTESVLPLNEQEITPKDINLQSSQIPNVVLGICKTDVFITMCSLKSSGHVLSRALAIMEQHKLMILDVNISSNESMAFYYFHLKALDEKMLLHKDALQTQLQNLTNI